MKMELRPRKRPAHGVRVAGGSASPNPSACEGTTKTLLFSNENRANHDILTDSLKSRLIPKSLLTLAPIVGKKGNTDSQSYIILGYNKLY